MLTSTDTTWAITRPMYWSIIETNIGILAASIPSFKPIAKRYLPRLIGEYHSGAYRSGVPTSLKGGTSRSRRRFSKLDNKEIAMGSMMDPKEGAITTTIVASQSVKSGGSSKEDVGDADSERHLVIQREQQGHIRQWTNITRTVETESIGGTPKVIDDGDRKPY